MITPVTLTCPHCNARYRVRVDLTKLRRVRSRARCSSCSSTFDVAEAIGHVEPSPSIEPAPERPSTRTIRQITVGGESAPPRPARVTPTGVQVPVFSLPAPKDRPAPLKLSDIPEEAAPSPPTPPPPADPTSAPPAPPTSQAWLTRALLPIDELSLDPTEGQLALDRLLKAPDAG
ncbi:MAG: MJ0042-type zinc finger domain-containing protein [Myxococcota bacterium]